MHGITRRTCKDDTLKPWGHVWPLVIVLILAAAAHSATFERYQPHDIIIYVSHWYDRVAHFGFAAFEKPFSNYTPPYLYFLWVASLAFGPASVPKIIIIIKLIAVSGSIWLSYALFHLFKSLAVSRSFFAALAGLLLPSVILNVSVLGQADMFWVTPCILAMTAAIEGRLVGVAFWSGVAFAFKAQAIFFAPFVMYLFIIERVPRWYWLIPALVYCAAMLPAWLAGWDWWYLVNVYFRQAAWQPEDRIFVSNSGSWWTIFGYFFPDAAIRVFSLGYLLAAVGVLGYLRLPPSKCPRMLLLTATLSATGLPFLLPGMHERFFILGDVLAFGLAVVMKSRSAIIAAVLIQIGSALPVATWAYDIRKAEIVAPFFMLGGLLILIEMMKEMGGQENETTDRLAPLANA